MVILVGPLLFYPGGGGLKVVTYCRDGLALHEMKRIVMK